MNMFTIYTLSLILLIAISIIVLRVFVRRDYLQRGQLTISSAILQALIFFLFSGFPILYLPDDWPKTHINLFLQAAGLASLTLGLAILFTSMFRLGVLRSLGLQTGPLKNTDSYRKTRNPQVIGYYLYGVGFGLLWPSWYALGWGLSLTGTIHLMVLTEEEHLRNAYGQDYEQYCQRVPRYLGYTKKLERDRYVDWFASDRKV
jgi:protein-S-isoprenylcysteine O-methyltransferase Ste14